MDPRLDQPYEAGGERRDGDRDADREPAAAGNEAAQQREQSAVAVFRNEALRRGAEPEIDRLSDHQHPGPDIDVDAELEGAHPAREQHLRAESQDGAADADQEHCAGKTLHQQVLGIEDARLELRP